MSRKVKVYTTPACPYCIRLKQFLRTSGVEFEDVDVSADQQAAEEMAEKSGQLAVPVLDIEGHIIVGFDKDAISRALEI